jgi:hypothetical protein
VPGKQGGAPLLGLFPAPHRVDAVGMPKLAALTAATTRRVALRARARRPGGAPEPRAAPRRGRAAAESRWVFDERGWMFALQVMPFIVVLGWLLGAAAVHDEKAAFAPSNQRAEHIAGSSGHPSTWSAAGGEANSSGEPTSATFPEEPSRRASEEAEPAVPGEPPRAPGILSWFSQSRFDVVIPEGGVRLPRFDVSLPRVGVVLPWDSDPQHAAALVSGVETRGMTGSGPAPVALFLASLGCLAVAEARRNHALRRRAGRAAEAAAEAEHPSPPPETEALEVTTSTAAAAPRPTTPQGGDQAPSPVADIDHGVAERSPAAADPVGLTPASSSEADGSPAFAAPDHQREPLEALAARPPTGTVRSSPGAPDDSGQGVRPHSTTDSTPELEGTIIRTRKRGRIRR